MVVGAGETHKKYVEMKRKRNGNRRETKKRKGTRAHERKQSDGREAVRYLCFYVALRVNYVFCSAF